MNSIKKKLKEETENWLERMENKKESVKARKETKEVKNSIKNIEAYIKDCRHFLGEEDYIRAFEAVVYAWGILETLERTGLVESGEKV